MIFRPHNYKKTGTVYKVFYDWRIYFSVLDHLKLWLVSYNPCVVMIVVHSGSKGWDWCKRDGLVDTSMHELLTKQTIVGPNYQCCTIHSTYILEVCNKLSLSSDEYLTAASLVFLGIAAMQTVVSWHSSSTPGDWHWAPPSAPAWWDTRSLF